MNARHMRRIAAALMVIAVSWSAWAAAGENEFKNAREIRAVETYVPYDEFLKITGKDPNATVMTLEEYRGLVDMATARNAKPKITPLPPIESSLMEAIYAGQAGEFSARFDVQFKLTVAGKEWTRCNLGAIQNLGHVTLDGQPGWVVLEDGRAQLLVKGAGLHSGTLSFALPLTIADDVQKLSATLLDAASSSVRMTVPGRAIPSSAEGALDSTYDAAANSTSFTCPVARPQPGVPPAVSLSWKRKYDSRKSEVLLQADHHMSYLLHPASPYFYWQSSVQIGRRKTSELAFAVPTGCRVIRLAGSGVHSWLQDGSALSVLLDEPTIGDVYISASGLLAAPAGDFDLSAPELNDARKNTRTLALYEPPNATMAMTKTVGLRELSLEDRPAIPRFQRPQWEGRLARQYFIEQPGAKAGVHVTPFNSVFDTRSAALLTIAEKAVLLRCTISVQPEKGRVFTLNLAVPPQWKLTGIKERGTGRGIVLEPVEEGKEDNWTVRLNDSAGVTVPFDLDMSFGLRDTSWAEVVWQTHALNFTLPAISGARRTESVLGVSAHASIDIAFGEMPGWRSDFAGALARLGVAETVLRAGLASEAPAAELRLDLSHNPPRGEYESVLHVQTTERELWVRADIRILALEHARAVDELVLSLPSDAKDPIFIDGKGVREVAPGAQPNQRIVRFDQPWREVRTLRVEYRALLAPETDVPVPDIRIEGNFDSRRWIVFQSAGVVSLEVKPGESLQAASLDDTPSFANPIKSGRALFAFTFGLGGKYGTFRTKNLESAPVLNNLVRELNLTTVLDESGVSRTHADMILSYSQQYMEVTLPPGAKLLGLYVDGESAKPVQGGSADAIRIPVPPHSTARVEMVYERQFGALGNFGSIELIAPEFSGFPVGATTWTVCHPAQYVFDIAGGNMTPHKTREPRFFARQFLDQVLSGEWPIWSAWQDEAPGATVGYDQGKIQQAQQQTTQAQSDNRTQALKSIEAAASPVPVKARAIGGLAIPEGASLKSAKLGGSARLVLAYRELTYSAFASRAMFVVALLLGVWLMLRRSFFAALVYLLAGLALGSLVPLALDWESPLLLVPFCEGLSAFALLLGAAYLSHGFKILLNRRSARLAAQAICAAVCVLGALTASPRTAYAGEAEPVLIPYPKDGKLPLETNPKDTKVYVPKSVFLDLMSRVKPEKKDPVVDAPMTKEAKPAIIPYSLGNAEYELSADDTSYTIKGTLDVTTYDPKGWAKVPLNFGPSRLASVKIDGQPAGVSNLGGVLFVQLNGAKKFVLEFELRGALILEAGRAILRGQVVPGGATRLTATLPANVELDTKALPAGAWVIRSPDGKTQRCEIALGLNGAVALSWHSPDIRGKGEARITSQSYMQFELGLDGYAVSRVERVTGDGAPVDQLSYQVVGDWNIAAAAAPGLSEWTVSGEGAEKRLRLWFQKPISDVTIQIAGWAPLGAADAPAAGLSLENALRKEGFIGLKHGEGRHFAARSFGDLKRASQEELAAAVMLPADAQPDRILHYNGTPGEARVVAEPEPSQTTLETQFAGVLRENQMTVGVRTRYTVSGRGPLRHEVELPPNWEVRTVRATLLRDWEIVENAGKRRLVIHFSGRAVTGVEIRWSAEAPLAVPIKGALLLELPLPRTVADATTVETVDWILAADASLSLSQSAGTTMQPVPVERAPRWVNLNAGQDWRLAFRSSKSDTRLAIDVARQDSALYATVVTFVSAAEEHVQIVARIRYRIERAGRDRFVIKLPAGAELTGLDAKNLRGRELVPGASGTLLTVLMQSPVSGEQIVDIAYRLPRTPGKDALAEPPSIEDAGARGVEHYAGLLPSENGAVALVSSRRLNPIKDAEELPFLPEKISKKALAEVFSGEPGWSMTLRETALKVEVGPAAEVVQAELVTTIASDGGVRSEATYRVRNHSLQFLEIEMPADATLWSVSIGGNSAAVSRTKPNVLSIPLPRMTETDLPARVKIVYESARAPLPALYLSFTPKAPRVLDVPVVETHWRIYVPEDYEAGRSGGNMKEVVGSVLNGSRVNSNIKEIARLAKIADTPEQRPAIRKKALQSIAVEQQELNDNVTALGGVESVMEGDESKRISREELNAQRSFNSDNLRMGNEWQGRLSEQKRKKELDDANSGNLDPEQVREYLDHFNFLNIHWRAGALSKKEAEPPAPPPSEMRLEDLLFLRRFAGYGKGELPQLPLAPAPLLEKSAALQGGLLDSGAGRITVDGTLSGFQSNEMRVGELRMTQLNYRCVEVHPELTLSLRSKSASLNWSAMAGLVLLAICGAAVFRMKRK